MILNKIYSEPHGLFEEVIFKNGMNIIFGKKEPGAPKESINSIGKSTFLDLIDFCLLSSYNKTSNPRLYSAASITKGYKVVLEFEIDSKKYTIKRSTDDPSFAEYGIGDNLLKYPIDRLKDIIAEKIFGRKDYNGIFQKNWYRDLMRFFLKIQKFKREQFLDPIQYIKDKSEVELLVYHLYLLGLDNTLTFDNFKKRTDLKSLKPALAELTRLLADKYNLHDLRETNSTINKLKLEIKKLDKAIAAFSLDEQYKDAEKEANKLTYSIKEKWLQNYNDRKKIESYESSYNTKEDISVTRIKNLYQEASKSFSLEVKKTLDEAIAFRKQLSISRKSFLADEINLLRSSISMRENEIKLLEIERAKFFSFLAAEKAIKDLTEAFAIISEKRQQLADLEGSTKIMNDLIREKIEIETEIKTIQKATIGYVQQINSVISDLYEIFTEIYNHIYIENQNESSFSITFNAKRDKFIDISITLPDMFGKGKNQGRTLIYDLFVLINNIKNHSTNFPAFLVHDGIFDGMDKAHFISVYEYIENLAHTGTTIQYITTINEEGELNDNFGNADVVSSDKIKNESILVLSPSNKLFGQDFTNTI